VPTIDAQPGDSLTSEWAFPYAGVPDAEPDAEVDPHWLSLRADPLLPSCYMPPAMAGTRAPWLRVCALVLVAVFVAATAAGICLTYGPPAHHFF
jgi:hypothetical protein